MLFYECKCYEITTVKITFAELVLVALESNDFTHNQSYCNFFFLSQDSFYFGYCHYMYWKIVPFTSQCWFCSQKLVSAIWICKHNPRKAKHKQAVLGCEFYVPKALQEKSISSCLRVPFVCTLYFAFNSCFQKWKGHCFP